MKQKRNFSESPEVVEVTPGQSGATEKKGLLEKLGDVILARLEKSGKASTDELGDFPMEQVSFDKQQLPGFDQPAQTNATISREEQISRALRGLAPESDQAPKEEINTAMNNPPAKPQAAPVKQAATVSRGQRNPDVSQAVANKQPPAGGPYVSRIRKKSRAASPQQARPMQNAGNQRQAPVQQPRQQRQAVAQTRRPAAEPPVLLETQASGGVRLTDSEKNKVYERVRNLITTARRTAETNEPKRTTRKTLKICFLEDSCTSSHAIREMLGENGHEVDHFSLAEEALDALMEKEYDILLASQIVALGGMDCAALIKTIRTSPNAARRNMPIIALTLDPDPENLRSFHAVGANDVIVKPVEGKLLNNQIMKLVTVTPMRLPQSQSQPSLQICFLEDSCTSSHAIREMLGEQGHEVDHFSSAEEALDALNDKNYDLLLASQIVSLGGMDCETLVQTIRRSADPRLRNTPVVVLTANPEPANLSLFSQAGANDVVVKPVEGKTLNMRLVAVAGRKRKVAPARGATGQPAANRPPPDPNRPLRVCFLEDSCTSSHAIREMLGEKGHEVDHFSSPEEALDAFMEKDYDVMLASQIVALGGMDCEGLVKTIRSANDPDKRNAPVVTLTANPDPANIENFFMAGASDVIVKPIEGSELNAKISQAVADTAVVPMPAPRAMPKHLRVCFLEDSCTSSHAIREMLGESGHEVDHFSSPEEALDALMEKDYDLLLASQIVSLGGLDCEGLIRAVRGSHNRAKQTIPVVVLTAEPSMQNQNNFMNAGANRVLVKPVEGNLSEQLLGIVSEANGAPAPLPSTFAPAPIPDHLSVCFLEDSCTSSHAIREMLGEHGHEVDHFSAPEEALDALMEKDYDLLLASQIVALGGMDTEGLVKTVRGARQPAKRQMPIVTLTANPDQDNVQGFYQAGSNRVIVKPVDGDLNAQVTDVVAEVRSGRPQLRVVPGQTRARTTQQRQPARQPRPAPPPAKTKPPAANNLQAEIARLNKTNPIPEDNVQLRSPAPKQPASLLDSLSEGAQNRMDGTPKAAPRQPGVAGALPAPGLKPKSHDRTLIYAIAVVAIVAIVFSTAHHFGEHKPVEMLTVNQGTVYQAINAPGRVVSKKKVDLTTGVPGQIVTVNVKEGDKVKKGEILAQLDDRDARIQVQRAEAQLESARKDVALTERTLDRLVRALQMGAVSRQMAEDAEAAVHASRAKQRVAAEEVRAAQLSAERLNVVAPFDGVVTTSFAVEGLWAEPPGPLFTLVNMSEREVEVKIDSADSADISIGQTVTLSSDAFPEHEWTEQILRVAPATGRDGNSAANNTISVYISLGPDAPPIRFGQQVDAQIRTASSDNALKVPFEAVTTRNGRSVVAVVEDERVHFQPVVTGIESFTHVEIVGGLEPGQQIILLNTELEEGDKVEPIEMPG
jgi:RND family efflux transporter MFP subunit